MDYQRSLIFMPNGICWLFCRATGAVEDEIDTNPLKMELHERDGPHAGDYMDVQLRDEAPDEVDISLHYYHQSGQVEMMPLDPVLLKQRLGCYNHVVYGYELFTARDALRNEYYITKHDYHLSGFGWSLRFSHYTTANTPRIHTHNFDDFVARCQGLNITAGYRGLSLNDVLYHHTHTHDDFIEVGSLINKTVYQGRFRGIVDVAVKVTPHFPGFSHLYEILHRSNACDNLVRFYGANFSVGCRFAFERCGGTFEMHMPFFHSNMFSTKWTKLVSGMTTGLDHLHSLGISHNNLNTSNVVLSRAGWVAKLCGMSHVGQLDERSKEKDIRCYVKTVLSCVTGGDYKFSDKHKSRRDLNDTIDSLDPRLSEVQYILRALLDQRLDLHQALTQYWLFGLKERIDYIRCLNAALKIAPNSDKARINSLRDFHRSPSWREKYSGIMNHMVRERNGYEYKDTVIDLILFMRNLFEHIAEVRAGVRKDKLGQTDEKVEADFRKHFPNLMGDIFTEVGYLVPKWRSLKEGDRSAILRFYGGCS